MVSKNINLALRGVQFLFTLLIMAIVGNMIQEAEAGNPSIVNFVMFVAVFSMLSLFYFIASIVMGFEFPALIAIILDALNLLFFFLAAVILSAKLGVHDCNNGDYTADNYITNGSDDREARCREAQASTTFLWFAFFTYIATTIVSIANRGGANLRSVGRPSAMSQV